MKLPVQAYPIAESRPEILTQTCVTTLPFNPGYSEGLSFQLWTIRGAVLKPGWLLFPWVWAPTKNYTCGWSPLPLLQCHEVSNSFWTFFLVVLGRDLSAHSLGYPNSSQNTINTIIPTFIIISYIFFNPLSFSNSFHFTWTSQPPRWEIWVRQEVFIHIYDQENGGLARWNKYSKFTR